MLYPFLLMVRYLPFWAVPLAIVLFEIGLYYYNRRERIPVLACFGCVGILLLSSIFWLVFEGYWRAGPFLRKYLEL
jgi:hypothetical protein